MPGHYPRAEHPTRADLQASRTAVANNIALTVVAYAVVGTLDGGLAAIGAYIHFWLLVWAAIAVDLAAMANAICWQNRAVARHNLLCDRLIDDVINAGDDMARPFAYGAQWARSVPIRNWNANVIRWRPKDQP